MRAYYGLVDPRLASIYAKDVAETFGGDVENVKYMLYETACAETGLGMVKDPTHRSAGRGLTQFDQIPFFDIINRTSKKDKVLVKEKYDIDLDKIESVDEINNSPVLAFIMTRLFYKKRREPIPDNIIDRAHYWKKWYNTEAGKGSADHYLSMVQWVKDKLGER